MSSKAPVLPNLFVVGAPRCGTTSIWHYLSAHPDVYMSGLKEPTYFGSDLTKIPNEFFVLEREPYLDLFRTAAAKKIRGEASVMYLLSKRAAEEIHALNPSARILIMLRDPIEVIPSYHGVLHWLGHEDIADLEAALAAEPARRRGERIPRSAMIREALYYSEVARFAPQVERFLRVFPPQQVKLLWFDEFAASPARSFASVLDFLGLQRIKLKRFSAENAHKIPRSLAFAAMVQRPPAFLKLLLNCVPQPRRFKLLVHLLVILNTKRGHRNPLSPGLKRQLRDQFAPDIRDLSQLTGRDLSAWLQEPASAGRSDLRAAS